MDPGYYVVRVYGDGTEERVPFREAFEATAAEINAEVKEAISRQWVIDHQQEL